MKQFPSIPRLANAPPELLTSGHLWIQEKVDGANLRFQLRESGLLVFGDRNRVYEADEIPVPYRHAVRHVREHLDRDAVFEATDAVESLVFFGEAMHRHAIEYDWDRTPSVLGFDIWSESHGEFLPPDVVERAFDRLNLHHVNAFEKEARAIDFSPDSYEIPQSAWYDGPAEGVIIRNKNGARAKLRHPRFRAVDDAVPVDGTPEELAARYATDRRIEKVLQKLATRDRSADFDAVYERVLEDVIREEHKRLFHARSPVDMRAFRTAVAKRTRRYLSNHE